MKFTSVKRIEHLREGGAVPRGIQVRRHHDESVLLINPFAMKQAYDDKVEGRVVTYRGEGVSGDCTSRSSNRALCAYVDTYRRTRQIRRVSLYVAVERGNWERLGTFLLTGYTVECAGMNRLVQFELTRVDRPLRGLRYRRHRPDDTGKKGHT